MYVHTYYTTSVNTVLIQYVLYVQHHTDVLIILLILRCCCVCGGGGGEEGGNCTMKPHGGSEV